MFKSKSITGIYYYQLWYTISKYDDTTHKYNIEYRVARHRKSCDRSHAIKPRSDGKTECAWFAVILYLSHGSLLRTKLTSSGLLRQTRIKQTVWQFFSEETVQLRHAGRVALVNTSANQALFHVRTWKWSSTWSNIMNGEQERQFGTSTWRRDKHTQCRHRLLCLYFTVIDAFDLKLRDVK